MPVGLPSPFRKKGFIEVSLIESTRLFEGPQKEGKRLVVVFHGRSYCYATVVLEQDTSARLSTTERGEVIETPKLYNILEEAVGFLIFLFGASVDVSIF